LVAGGELGRGDCGALVVGLAGACELDRGGDRGAPVAELEVVGPVDERSLAYVTARLARPRGSAGATRPRHRRRGASLGGVADRASGGLGRRPSRAVTACASGAGESGELLALAGAAPAAAAGRLGARSTGSYDP
jgi:hypothetical protein